MSAMSAMWALRGPERHEPLRGRGMRRPRPGGTGAGPLLCTGMCAVLKLDSVLERARRDVDALHSAPPRLAEEPLLDGKVDLIKGLGQGQGQVSDQS